LDDFGGAIKWGDSVKFPGTSDTIKLCNFLRQNYQRSIEKTDERHQKNPSNLGRPRHALENKNITRNK
jgi:hypothetical protein